MLLQVEECLKKGNLLVPWRQRSRRSNEVFVRKRSRSVAYGSYSRMVWHLLGNVQPCTKTQHCMVHRGAEPRSGNLFLQERTRWSCSLSSLSCRAAPSHVMVSHALLCPASSTFLLWLTWCIAVHGPLMNPRYFDGAPLIKVPGRVFPVELRYVPTSADNDVQEARVSCRRCFSSRPVLGCVL